MKKLIIKIVVGLILLPGFLLDLCFAASFLLNDGKENVHRGDFIFYWAIGLVPKSIEPAIAISMIFSAAPAAVLSFAFILAAILGLCYLLTGLIFSTVAILLTGEVKWITILDI